MNYRTLLVHLDDRERCATRVELAARLATGLDAHLVGLAPTGVLDLPMEIGPGIIGVDLLTSTLAGLRRTAEERAERFRTQCESLGLKSFESVVDDTESSASVLMHSHCSDLTIVGQADPGGIAAHQVRVFVEKVVLDNPRPTLVVPYAGRWPTMGQTVLVAWNETREAARAMADAMPLLRRAKDVHIVQCATPSAGGEGEIRTRLDALHHWLLWHGVEAHLHLEPKQIGVADAVLSRAADLSADLLVMGAYGHTRWSEQMLGGATRDVLREMTLPVLMSH